MRWFFVFDISTVFLVYCPTLSNYDRQLYLEETSAMTSNSWDYSHLWQLQVGLNLVSIQFLIGHSAFLSSCFHIPSF